MEEMLGRYPLKDNSQGLATTVMRGEYKLFHCLITPAMEWLQYFKILSPSRHSFYLAYYVVLQAENMNPGIIMLRNFLEMGSQKRNYKLSHKVLQYVLALTCHYKMLLLNRSCQLCCYVLILRGRQIPPKKYKIITRSLVCWKGLIVHMALLGNSEYKVSAL